MTAAVTSSSHVSAGVAEPSPSRTAPRSTATIGSTTVRHAMTTSGGPEAKACCTSQPPTSTAAPTPATAATTGGSSTPTWPDATDWDTARTSAETRPNATAPAIAQATHRTQPERARPTPASTRTIRATTRLAMRVDWSGGGELTAVLAAVATNTPTPPTLSSTPTNTPPAGTRPRCTAVRTTAIGTASTPIGWTTDSGASTSAPACSADPAAATPRPRSHPGRRVTASSPRNDSAPLPASPSLGGPDSVETAWCCRTAAHAKQTA